MNYISAYNVVSTVYSTKIHGLFCFLVVLLRFTMFFRDRFTYIHQCFNVGNYWTGKSQITMMDISKTDWLQFTIKHYKARTIWVIYRTYSIKLHLVRIVGLYGFQVSLDVYLHHTNRGDIPPPQFYLGHYCPFHQALMVTVKAGLSGCSYQSTIFHGFLDICTIST